MVTQLCGAPLPPTLRDAIAQGWVVIANGEILGVTLTHGLLFLGGIHDLDAVEAFLSQCPTPLYW